MTSKHSKNQFGNSTHRRSSKIKDLPLCPNCSSNRQIIRHGKRHIKIGQVHVFRCTACRKNFTTRILRYTQYPNHIILNTISTYNLNPSLTSFCVEIYNSLRWLDGKLRQRLRFRHQSQKGISYPYNYREEGS